jgi:hypothetical protein
MVTSKSVCSCSGDDSSNFSKRISTKDQTDSRIWHHQIISYPFEKLKKYSQGKIFSPNEMIINTLEECVASLELVYGWCCKMYYIKDWMINKYLKGFFWDTYTSKNL